MSLCVEHLHKKYGEKTVVEDLSFTMADSGVYALLGTNGAGKTTSIRMMLGMLAMDGGRVLWNDKPLDSTTCNIGYLAEERGLYPKYTLMDQLHYFAALRGVPKSTADRRIRDLAERLDATEYLFASTASSTGTSLLRSSKKQKPKLADQLSKGNQQKIQFMIALLSDPELLVLDEPLSGLDPVNTDLFKGIIRDEISRGKYVIMSSHQMATVEEFCTDITILDRAKTVLQGNLNTIKKSYGRVKLYIKTEADITDAIADAGIMLLSRKEWEYHLKVTDELQANRLLAHLMERRVPIITFDLQEPSLHEIFVEKVGEKNEAIQA